MGGYSKEIKRKVKDRKQKEDFRESSIKTRIETELFSSVTNYYVGDGIMQY